MKKPDPSPDPNATIQLDIGDALNAIQLTDSEGPAPPSLNRARMAPPPLPPTPSMPPPAPAAAPQSKRRVLVYSTLILAVVGLAILGGVKAGRGLQGKPAAPAKSAETALAPTVPTASAPSEPGVITLPTVEMK